ncbi:MAG: L,D-transpeptidase family protein [Bryobacteraceae bacterium]
MAITLLALPLVVQAGKRESTEVNGVASDVNDASKTPNLAPGATGNSVVRAQILLDRARFSPGEIDGIYGESLAIAVKGYQKSHDMKATGIVDAGMWKLLNRDTGSAMIAYTILKADPKHPFLPVPEDTLEKSKMKWLGFENAEESLGERFHAAPKLLAHLNPGKDLALPGEKISVPNVRPEPPRSVAARVVVSKANRTVTAFAASGKLLAQYPATIGSAHDPLPIGKWNVTSVVHYPWFNYDPELFWNPDPKKAKAVLPPGPNNPTGTVWIGLTKEHYGIHGTPEPGAIHHSESAGCIRMTNWDTDDLARMVRRGTPVLLEE